MAGKEIAVKKYVVRLDAEEHDRLNELIRKGNKVPRSNIGADTIPSRKVPVASPDPSLETGGSGRHLYEMAQVVAIWTRG